MPLITHDLVKAYRGRRVVDEVSLRVERGEVVGLELRLEKSDESEFVRHVVRMDVFSPSGKLLRHYSGSATTRAGIAEWRLPLALNDEIGQWIVRATEVVSGAAAETTLRVD